MSHLFLSTALFGILVCILLLTWLSWRQAGELAQLRAEVVAYRAEGEMTRLRLDAAIRGYPQEDKLVSVDLVEVEAPEYRSGT